MISLYMNYYFTIVLCFTISIQSVKSFGGKIIVAGGTGKLGRLVVQELLSYDNNLEVVATTRNLLTATSIFSTLPFESKKRLTTIKFDLGKTQDIEGLCANADAMIWCASGSFTAPNVWSNILEKIRGPNKPIDITALEEFGRILAGKTGGICSNGPRVVMCSSAGVTRPTWSDDKKQKLIGASDIPIVRLNPGNILGIKLQSEEALKNSNVKYSIVRPCGLNDNWPSGRPIISQGDVAVGRMCRGDVAHLLVKMLFDSSAVDKTFECISIPGYPKPRNYSDQLNRLQEDRNYSVDEKYINAQYSIMQQLVPGETLAPNNLAMGQTYEQLDNGVQGRLGPRGSEVIPQLSN